MTRRYDAIVIGGGVAGGTAAILLAQAGWSVALVEKRAFPRRKVCGECIAAPNLALLDALDVGAEFAQIAGPELTRVTLYVGEDEICAELPRQDGAGAGFARALGEFGATITFVSNIPGETQTISAAIYTLTQVPGGDSAALNLVIVAIIISFAALLASEWFARRAAARLHGS